MAGDSGQEWGAGKTVWDASARSGRAALGARRALSNRQRRLLVGAPPLIVLHAVLLHTVGLDTSRLGACLAAAGISVVVALVLRPLLVLLVMLCLGARPIHLRTGTGPLLGFHVGTGFVASFHAIPISFTVTYLPRPRHYGRDLRIMFATIVLAPLALTPAACALLLPPYVRALSVVLGLLYTAMDAATVQPDLPRTMGARAFPRTSKDFDPATSDPHWGAVAHGVAAAGFGDIEGAAAQIQYLRSRRHASGAAGIETVIYRVRGNCAGILRTYGIAARGPRAANPAAPAPHTRALREFLAAVILARFAATTLLLVERDPRGEPGSGRTPAREGHHPVRTRRSAVHQGPGVRGAGPDRGRPRRVVPGRPDRALVRAGRRRAAAARGQTAGDGGPGRHRRGR